MADRWSAPDGATRTVAVVLGHPGRPSYRGDARPAIGRITAYFILR
jgi:hypothetical protein